MQGYIIRIAPSRNEDLIVTLLTKNTVYTAYRFYGARHSTVNLGFKIDAELIYSPKSNMPQLRNILHLSYPWLYEQERMFFWQNFIMLFYDHLKGIYHIDEFYFQLLDEISLRMQKQNPKRLLLEFYLKLLEFEGRLHVDKRCFICEEKIHENISLTRAFLPAHAKCISSSPMNLSQVNHFLEDRSAVLLDDLMVQRLWKIMLEGF